MNINFDACQAETRELRDGNRMLMQGRRNVIKADGYIEHGEWSTICVITNYGEVFDKKQRLFNWVKHINDYFWR